MQLPKKLQFLTVVLFLSVSLFIFYKDTLSFSISGDDLYQYIEAPRSWKDIVYLFTFIQQYRPIPHIFFLIYHLIPLSLPLFHAVSLIWVIMLSYLFYYFLTGNLKLNRVVAGVVSIGWSTSHIMFYHLYTLSGIADLVFILFFWMTILSFSRYSQSSKKLHLIVSYIFFVLCIFTKEIIVSIPLIILASVLIYRSKNISIQKNIKVSLVFLFMALLFYGVKIAFYKSNGSAYTYTISVRLLFENSKHFILWFLNYKHGWQMGMPVPPPKLYYVCLAVWVLITGGISVIAFVSRKKDVLFFMIWLFAGLLPFYFLDRVLVYYLNISLIAFYAIVGLGFDSLVRKRKYAGGIMLGMYLITSLYISDQIRTQWKKYSFVAVANETSKNFYKAVVQKYYWSKYKVLCISDLNPDAYWAIAGGQAFTVFRKEKIKILTSRTRLTDPVCKHKSAVNIRNDGRKFIAF